MKNLKVSYLLDFYGSLFSEKQKSILEMYFQEDMSLSEIAAEFSMTRQGVYDNIKRGEKEIMSLESRLNLMDRFMEISKSLDNIKDTLVNNTSLDDNDRRKIEASISRISNLI